ncbi:unnamed protein product [Trichogramma brassicae]|uniref:Uncharacterized protein n=1 Tax=Trichogramma brassicae TaxID=86971 RepID=A0A6H5I1K7_9HYME|nr:unnamed protein product [Trichogramma brassicae]
MAGRDYNLPLAITLDSWSIVVNHKLTSVRRTTSSRADQTAAWASVLPLGSGVPSPKQRQRFRRPFSSRVARCKQVGVASRSSRSTHACAAEPTYRSCATLVPEGAHGPV